MHSLYSNLCIVVPFMPNQAVELMRFDEKHDFFIRKGGRIIYKSCGKMDFDLATKVKKPNTILIEKNDKSLYEAWNQSLDFLEYYEIGNNHYIIWLGLDDELNEKFVDEACRVNRDELYFDFIYGDAIATFNNSKRYLISKFPPQLFSTVNCCFDIFHPGMMNRWEVIRGNRFDTKYMLAADLDFYIGISSNRKVTFKKLAEVQAYIGSEGVSKSFSAMKIYLKEWREIEGARSVTIKIDYVRSSILQLFTAAPNLYSIIRKIYWRIFGVKNIG